jgi:hypothetical protein
MESCFNFFNWCKEFSNEYVNWFDVVIYIIAFVALFFAIRREYLDLYCPKDGQVCKIGNGAAYAGGKPSKYDNVDVLLEKIRISSKYDESSVYWRRVIIFSVLLLFTLLVLVLRRLPTGTEALISFIVIYLFTFLFLVYYQEVVSKPATQQVNEATALLAK